MNNIKLAAVLLIVVLLSVLTYVTLILKKDFSTTTEAVQTSSEEKVLISLKTIPVTFELPAEYAIFQREGYEGGYSTMVSVGKEISHGHYYYAPLSIEFTNTVYDYQLEREYSPKEYVDIVFNEQSKDEVSNPQYIELFGNKAVRYKNAADDSISIIGYLSIDKLPNLSSEYLVKISSFTYGSGVDADIELFDIVINSLKVNN